MSIGASSGDNDSQTQIDPRFADAWFGLNDEAKKAAQKMGDVPDKTVADWSQDQKDAAHDIRQISNQNVGLAEVQRAISAADRAARFDPTMISNEKARAFNFEGADLAPADQMTAAQAGDPAQMRAAQAGDVSYSRAALAGPAAGVDASSVSLAKLGQVDPRLVAETNLGKYMNPYEKGVIDSTVDQVTRSRNRQRQGDKADAIAAGAFGGSREGVQRALTNEAYDRELVDKVANLKSGGFTQATQLAAQDADRALAGDSQNLQARLAALGQNSSQELAARLATTDALNTGARFDATQQQNNAQFNTASENARAEADAARRQQSGMLNTDALNTGAQFDAGLRQEQAKSNSEWNNQFALQQGQLDQQSGIFNATNNTGISQFNAGQDLVADQANQDAAAQGAGVQLQGAGMLGQLGGQKLDQAYQRSGQLMGLGNTVQGQNQAQIDARYQNAMADYETPLKQLQTLALPYGIMPGTGQGSSTTSNSTAKQMAAGG